MPPRSSERHCDELIDFENDLIVEGREVGWSIQRKAGPLGPLLCCWEVLRAVVV